MRSNLNFKNRVKNDPPFQFPFVYANNKPGEAHYLGVNNSISVVLGQHVACFYPTQI